MCSNDFIYPFKKNTQIFSLCVVHMWWIRTFKVISNKKAKELGLRHWRSVYGDEINHRNCRSLWYDNKQRIYRVNHLEDVS